MVIPDESSPKLSEKSVKWLKKMSEKKSQTIFWSQVFTSKKKLTYKKLRGNLFIQKNTLCACLAFTNIAI